MLYIHILARGKAASFSLFHSINYFVISSSLPKQALQNW
jgi:hypothetical protein